MHDQRIIDLRNRKIESQMTYEEIAQKSGLSLSSVQKVLGGATASLSFSLILSKIQKSPYLSLP